MKAKEIIANEKAQDLANKEKATKTAHPLNGKKASGSAADTVKGKPRAAASQSSHSSTIGKGGNCTLTYGEAVERFREFKKYPLTKSIDFTTAYCVGCKMLLTSHDHEVGEAEESCDDDVDIGEAGSDEDNQELDDGEDIEEDRPVRTYGPLPWSGSFNKHQADFLQHRITHPLFRVRVPDFDYLPILRTATAAKREDYLPYCNYFIIKGIVVDDYPRLPADLFWVPRYEDARLNQISFNNSTVTKPDHIIPNTVFIAVAVIQFDEDANIRRVHIVTVSHNLTTKLSHGYCTYISCRLLDAYLLHEISAAWELKPGTKDLFQGIYHIADANGANLYPDTPLILSSDENTASNKSTFAHISVRDADPSTIPPPPSPEWATLPPPPTPHIRHKPKHHHHHHHKDSDYEPSTSDSGSDSGSSSSNGSGSNGGYNGGSNGDNNIETEDNDDDSPHSLSGGGDDKAGKQNPFSCGLTRDYFVFYYGLNKVIGADQHCENHPRCKLEPNDHPRARLCALSREAAIKLGKDKSTNAVEHARCFNCHRSYDDHKLATSSSHIHSSSCFSHTHPKSSRKSSSTSKSTPSSTKTVVTAIPVCDTPLEVFTQSNANLAKFCPDCGNPMHAHRTGLPTYNPSRPSHPSQSSLSRSASAAANAKPSIRPSGWRASESRFTIKGRFR